MRSKLGLAGLLLLLAACAKVPDSVDATNSMDSEARVLCLAVPETKTAANQGLREAQARARARGTEADWVAVGRQWVRTARQSSDAGFYLNVDACAELVLERQAQSVAALELRSLVLLNNHRFDAARALAEEILKVAPDSVIALGTLSDAWLELGRYESSALAAQRQLDLKSGMAAMARGSYLRWLHGDSSNAKRLIRAALNHRDRNDPEPAAWTLVEAATIYWHEGDYAGADALYAEALNWVVDFPAALIGRARIALGNEQPQLAIELLQRVRGAQAPLERAWLLGDAYARAGDQEQAEQRYSEVLRQGRRGDRLNLALFLLAKNRAIDQALQILIEERRTRAGIYLDDAYAFALHRAGRHDEALAVSEVALRLGTRDARLLYHAGAIRIAAGERAAGRRLIEQALQLNPRFDSDGAAEARALLANERVAQAAARP